MNVVALLVTAFEVVAFVVLAFKVAKLPVVPKSVVIVAETALKVLVMSVVKAPIPAVRFVSVVEARVEEPVALRFTVLVVEAFEVDA